MMFPKVLFGSTSATFFCTIFVELVLWIDISSSFLLTHMPPSWEAMCQAKVTEFLSDKKHKHPLSPPGLGENYMKPIHRARNDIHFSQRTTEPPEMGTSAKHNLTGTKTVEIKCKIPHSHDVHWKLMDLQAWEVANLVNTQTEPSNRHFVFVIDVECENGANISLPWPMKSEGLHEIHVRNCGLVDQYLLAYNPLVSEIPDELRILEIRNSFWLVDLKKPNKIIENSPFDFINVDSSYDCGQDETLEVYISSNVTLLSHDEFRTMHVNGTVGDEYIPSLDETFAAMFSSPDSTTTTTPRVVRPEDRLVTNRESAISDQHGVGMADIPNFPNIDEFLVGGDNNLAENSEANVNLSARHDFLELLKKIHNTRIECDFVKLLVRDESMSSDTPTHLLQIATQESLHPVLEVLNYSNIGMVEFPRELRQWRMYFPRLRYLDLSYNNITELKVDDFPPMSDTITTIMNIRHNNLSSISPAILKTWASVLYFHVDFRNNPISCDCDMKDMIHFLRNSSTFTGRMQQYEYVKHLHCHSPPHLKGRTLISLNVGSLPCPHIASYQGLIIALGVMLAVFVIFTIILIKFKIEIRILLYTRFHVRLPCDSDAHRSGGKLYDAFVSYANEDSNWVIANLVNFLEKDVGTQEVGQKTSSTWKRHINKHLIPFKLCLHQRDFVPGKTIVDNIIDSIEASRHTIIVLSPSFMRSHWAMEELRQAYRQSLVEKTRHLIVLLLDKVPNEDMDPLISRCVKTFTYLQVQDAIFRDKLVFSLCTKDQATRRRDRLMSRRTTDETLPQVSQNGNKRGLNNITFIPDSSSSIDIDIKNGSECYEYMQSCSVESSSQNVDKNEIFQSPQNGVVGGNGRGGTENGVGRGGVTDIRTNGTCYYSVGNILGSDSSNSSMADYANISISRCSSEYPVTGSTLPKPHAPARVLSNSSTSSTTALTWET